MSVDEIKEKIQTLADNRYGGGYRHIKPKLLLSLIGKEGVDVLYSKIDPELHTPYSLAIYCFMNDIKHSPTCPCGTKTKFNTTTKEFSIYCSNKCKWENNDKIQEAKRKTCLAKYGSINVLSSEYGKEKSKNTQLEKYGVENYTQTEEYKSKTTGVKRSKEQGERIRTSILRRYYESMIERFPNVEPLFDVNNYHGVAGYRKYPWMCKVCNTTFVDSISFESPPTCRCCKPVGTKHELIIRNFLNTMGISHEYNWRKLPSGKELDIYIPEKNIGIEICGLYWHSTSRGCERMYHKNKLDECTNSGIQLITIFDDELYNKKPIVFNRIKSKLGLIHRKIYARKCTVREITAAKCKTFLAKYHIQGPINGSYRYGLFHKSRMVAVMTFNKGRLSTGKKSQPAVYELGRYATISNFSVVGGAGKLFKHFIKTVNPLEVFSYCDKRWNEGKVYESIGMIYSHDTDPNYSYTKDCKNRLHRFLFQKNKLKYMDSYSDDSTEEEIMQMEGYHRIYDCGSKVFIWKNPHLKTK